MRAGLTEGSKTSEGWGYTSSSGIAHHSTICQADQDIDIIVCEELFKSQGARDVPHVLAMGLVFFLRGVEGDFEARDQSVLASAAYIFDQYGWALSL